MKDNNVPDGVGENKQQQPQKEVQVNNINGDGKGNSNVNEQQQQTAPPSSLEVFNILNKVNFEMDTISNNITTTLNFDLNKNKKTLSPKSIAFTQIITTTLIPFHPKKQIWRRNQFRFFGDYICVGVLNVYRDLRGD